MSVLPDADTLADAIAAKADVLRTTLSAKVDANLTGGVLQTRSGALRRSIVSALDSSLSSVTVSLESDGVAYAAIQEFGGRTSAHEIVAVKAKALAFVGAGGGVFARTVHHPGSTIPARSYLGSALADAKADIVAGMHDAILDALAI